MGIRALGVVVVTSLLLLGVTSPGHAAVTIDRAEMSGSSLRVEGERAVPGAAIRIDGVQRGTADRRGRFDVTVSQFSTSTCRISVDDGTGAVQTSVRNCTPTAPPPPPPPPPDPEPTVTTESVSLEPTSVTAGGTSTATVTLTGAAPAGGAQVTLASSDTSVAGVPAGVTVPAGATTATATVSTQVVPSTRTATISAAHGGVTGTATLTVSPPPGSSVSLDSLTIPAEMTAGSTADGTVTLTGAAPSGGASVSMSSTNTGIVRVPSTVTVPTGQTTATFTVTAMNASTVSATVWASLGVSISAEVRVVAPPPAEVSLTSLTISPGTVVGGQPAEGTVTFTAPVPQATVVPLSSTEPAVASVPASVTVPSGATSAGFTVTTQPVSGTGTFAVISGSHGGVQRSASISVNPGAPAGAPAVSSVTFSSSTLQGSHPATGTVRLDGPATDGAVVDLTSSHPDLVQVPAEVVIAVNATSVAFPVTTRSTQDRTAVTITATARCCGARGTVTAALTVTPTTSPPVADTVRITDVEWRRCIFSIEATGSDPDAILTVHLSGSGSVVLTLTNLGGGRYAGERAWRPPGTNVPVDITLRSNFGGKEATTVADPEGGECRADL